MVVRNVVEVHAITDAGMIQLVMDDGRTAEIPAGLLKTALDPNNDLVYVYDASESQLALGVEVYEPNFYSLNYADITDPVEANAGDLLNAVLDLIASTRGGSVLPTGAATSANQVTEIARLTSILAQLDITQTQLATAIKGSVLPYGNGCTLKDIYDIAYSTYQQIGRINNRQATAYITFVYIGNFATAILATAGANTWLAGAGVNVVGEGFEVVPTAAGTYDVFVTTASGF